MKKFWFLIVVCLVFLVVGCSKKINVTEKIDITDNNLNVESCDKYFKLMDCILENDSDERYTDEMRDQLRENVKSIQQEWEDFDKESLDEMCNAELSRFEAISDSLDEIGCSIN